jgi:DNA-directed RNA polymerase specialized sigma subunit
MGSSTRIREEYKGRKKEFRKDIVSVQPTRSIAFVVEGFLVNEWQLSQDKCLNAKLGGMMQHGKCSRERQLAGIAKAKAAGKYKGAKLKLTDEQLDELTIDFYTGMPKTEIAKKYGITRSYVYQLVKINENKP